MHRVGKSPPNVQGAFNVRTDIVCLCVRVSPPLAAKKYAELFGKEKKEKKAKEPKMAAEATPKKEKKEKKPVVKEEAEEEEEEEEKPRAPAFKDPYLDLPKRCVYMRICVSMLVCLFVCLHVLLCVCVSVCHPVIVGLVPRVPSPGYCRLAAHAKSCHVHLFTGDSTHTICRYVWCQERLSITLVNGGSLYSDHYRRAPLLVSCVLCAMMQSYIDVTAFPIF